MANTLTISVTTQDSHDIKENPAWSPSKIFRSAMKLHRKLEAFDLYSLEEYPQKILDLQSKFAFLQNEILKREEKIDSLKNVLEENILAQRRVRKDKQGARGAPFETPILDELAGNIGEQREELAWPRKPED